MGKFDYTGEVAENLEQKCLCVLVLDVSGSMRGKAIAELNKGLQDFYHEIEGDDTTRQRLEFALITFNQTATILQQPALVENFTIPTLEASGTTAMADAVNSAIDLVASRKNWYKETNQAYYRPWIVLMTDGEPDSNQDMDGLAMRIKEDVAIKKYMFLPIAVEGANMNVLQKIAAPEFPPLRLAGTKFIEFFKWLSASMETVTHSEVGGTVGLPKPDDWMEKFVI